MTGLGNLAERVSEAVSWDATLRAVLFVRLLGAQQVGVGIAPGVIGANARAEGQLRRS